VVPALADGETQELHPVRPQRRARGLSAWRYQPEGRRDLRFDFLRGFCAFAMVVDHLGGGSFLYPMTGGNRFFASAAEGFIFLSGLLVGLIYGPRVVRDGLAPVQLHLLRRSATLYGVTIGLTFTFVGLSRLAGMPWLQDVELLTPQLVVSLLTLHHTYYLVDVMLLYTILLAVAPLAMLLLHTGRTRTLLAGIVGLWAIHLFFPQQTTVPWEIVNNETFQIASWQIWFFGGMVIGYHREAIARWFARVPMLPLALVLMCVAAGLIYLRLVASDAAVEPLFDKNLARPGRLVAFGVFFGLFYLALTYLWTPFERLLGWLFLPFGQNALYVYALHLFAVYITALVLPYVPGFDRFNPWMNTPVQVIAVLVLWLLVKRQVLFDVIPR
jgi:hypothetical protein